MFYSGVDVFGSSFNIAAHFSNLKLWLGGQVMLELKSVKVFYLPMTTRQALRQLHCLSRSWTLNTGTRPMESQSSISQGKKCPNFSVARPLFYAPMRLCLGFIAADAAAEKAARMAARARRARQLLGKEIFRCYQCTQRGRLLYSPPPMYSPATMYYSAVQLVHVDWKIIEYTVVHATSDVLYCTFR